MRELSTLVVYGSDARSLIPLEAACRGVNLTFAHVRDGKEFREAIATVDGCYIIVPFTSDKIGEATVDDFKNVAFQILRPEDAVVRIIYSTEGTTPVNWPWRNLDPRPVTDYDDMVVQTFFYDTGWTQTIAEIIRCKNSRFSYVRHKHNLLIDIDRTNTVPFPSEAEYLLRSAFKDMSKISVKFPKQGFSGSITCFVSPFDGSGRKCKELFVKIYDEHAKAFQEYRNALEYVDKYNIDYPRHQHYRRYQGIGYSLMVTECTRGPHNRSWTFFDIIKTDTVPINDIRFFLRKLLAILNKWNIRQEKVDLVDCYLGKILKNDNRRRKLESDNRCHRWFGIFTDGLDIEKKTRNFFQEMGIEGTAIGICHGDLHLNNILVKTEGKRLVPVLIDFSRTGSTHFMTDCVTIEIDLIIRGIEGIKAFIDIDTLSLFLNSLETKGQAKRFIQKTKMNKRDMLRIRKIFMIIEMIRAYAYSTYQVSPIEYIGSALLKTLEVLSYGMLPFDQNARATVYVDYLISGIISAKK